MSDAALRRRSRQQAWAASGGSHDRLIGALRIALPIAILALAVLLALAPMLSGRDISFVLNKDRGEVAHDRLRVTDAIYRGNDDKDQPFKLRAGSAVQASAQDPVVRLTDLTGEIALDDGPATVRARTGRYDMDRQTVAIDGAVTLRAADGYRLDTRDVAIDLPTRRVASAGAVGGTLPIGTFAAAKLDADLPARIVVLTGRARLHIVQGAARGRR